MSKAKYFAHDADMRNDIKIKALRRKYGHKGYAVWCFVLETLTDSDGFEVDYNEITQSLLAADFDLTTDELAQIVEYSTQIGLLTVDDGRLYCKTLNRRFDEINQKQEAISAARSIAGKKGMQARWGSRNADNKAITNDNNVITSDNNGITNITKRKEKKEKEKKETYPYQDICALWNSLCGVSLPKVKALNEARRAKVRARLTEAGAKSAEEATTWAESVFKRCAASDFLCGRRGGSWRASFDWLFSNSVNWQKVMEGNYDNERNTTNGTNREDSAAERGRDFAEYITRKLSGGGALP